jgi:hypothetical protein
MKKIHLLFVCCAVLVIASASGQQSPAKPGALPTFNLNFPGGSPGLLVDTIEHACGKPVNVIINKQDEDVALPALKMTGVNVAQLFKALELASAKSVRVENGPGQYFTSVTTSYSFKTSGEPTENSVWYFHVDRPPKFDEPDKMCRFYSLDKYLNYGFSVDDITTAIQIGWKMAGKTHPPRLEYHRETKLLIAYGEPGQLNTIDEVLRTMPGSNIAPGELDKLRNSIKDLQKEVATLKSTLPHPRPGAPSEEKTGK